MMDTNNCKTAVSEQKEDLLYAVEKSTLARVKELFDSFSNLDKGGDFFDYKLLVTALKRQHKSISNFLIKKNCRVRAPIEIRTHGTPLYYAVKINDLNIFKELYNRGASLHDRVGERLSALELAMLYQHKCSLTDLVLKIDLPDPAKWKTSRKNDVALFHAACFTNNLVAVETLLARGFSVRSRSGFHEMKWESFTPLHFAISGSAKEAVDALLEHDVDFHAKDGKGRTALHLAFRLAKHDLVEKIFKSYGARGQKEFHNSVDQTGLNHFHIVCSTDFTEADDLKNQMSFMKYLIKHDLNINGSISENDQDYPGFTALHFAAYYSCFNVMKLLLESGADPAKVDRAGRTPLHSVARNFSSFKNERDFKIIELLLKYGANLNAKDNEKSTPLHRMFYMQNENDALIEFLQSKIQTVKNLVNCHGLSYFHIACAGVDPKAVKRFLQKGASVQHCTKSYIKKFRDYSPLLFAINFNRAEIVKYLLDHKANPSGNQECEISPLQLACSREFSRFWKPDANDENEDDWLSSRENQIRIVGLLLEYGASVNDLSQSNKSALLEAITFPESMRYWSFDRHKNHQKRILNEITTRQKIIIDILLSYGADVNNGESLLHTLTYQYIICRSRKDLAEIFLKNGANVNAESGHSTPFSDAVRMQLEPSILDLYIRYGANVNHADASERDYTPLHTVIRGYSSRNPNDEIILSKLLDHPDINLDAQDESKETPLHIAIRYEKDICIQKLLDAGADVNVENNNGYPPIHICYYRLQDPIYSRSSKVPRAVIILVTHVRKLMRLGLFVSEKVRACYQKIIPELSMDDSVIDAELELLRSFTIDCINTSLYDILFKSVDGMAKHVKNSRLQKTISSEQLEIEFPLFHGFLKRQYRKGLKRRSALDSAKEALQILTNVNWPDSCAEHILKHLKDEYLDRVIKSIPPRKFRERSRLGVPSRKKHCEAKQSGSKKRKNDS